MKNIYVCFLYRKRKRNVASWLDEIHLLWYRLKSSEPSKSSFQLLFLSSRLLLATQKDGIEGYCKAHTAFNSDSIWFGDPTPQPLKQRNKASASVSTLVTSVTSVTSVTNVTMDHRMRNVCYIRNIGHERHISHNGPHDKKYLPYQEHRSQVSHQS